MKQITINFTASKIVSDYELGKIGEHNATELTITPPTSLSGDERTAMYRIAFYTGSETILTESFTGTPIVINLWQQLTQHARLSLQVIAYDTDGEFIGKTDRLTGFYFNPSVDIDSVIDEDDTPDITAEISANTAARHTHSNKTVLDEIPAYEAGDTDKALVVGSDGLEWGTVASNGAIEIWSTGTTAAYSATQLKYYADEGKHFTYKGYPVIAYGFQIVPEEFYFTYLRTKNTLAMDIPQYVPKCKVVGTTITESNAKPFVLKINNATPNDNGNISLNIPAAQIQSDWEQSDTEALDYIKNKPTIPSAQVQADWNEADNTKADYIKNKPATMPPSSHTHTKSDITDFSHTHTTADITDLSYPVTDVQVNGTSVVSSGIASITVPDISGCEVKSNIVTSGNLDNASTDTQYPSAKCVYDGLTAKQNTLTAGTGISIVGDTISATGGALPVGTAKGDMLFWNGLAWVAHNPEVPLGYTPIEYIEGTGTQYIKTNVYISGVTEITIEASATSWLGSGNGIFGCRQGNGDKMFELLALAGSLRTDYGNNSYYTFTVTGGKHKFTLNSGRTYVDDTLLNTATRFTDWVEYEPCFFSSNQSGTPNSPFAMKLYGAKIYVGSCLVGKYIPCVRDSDSVAGLYDTVRQEFLTNAGTGTFVIPT